MSNNFKNKDIKNRTYYFFDDMINIWSLDLNRIKIVENSYKIFSTVKGNDYRIHFLYMSRDETIN